MRAKWFKHYADAHEGLSLQTLLDEYKHAGPCVYWILVEMCTSKFWEIAANNPDKNLRELECKFKFHKRLVLQKTRLRLCVLLRILERCNELSLLSARLDGNALEISMPKILEILDRDSKRPRKERVKSAAQSTDLREQKTESPKPPNSQTAETETDSEVDPGQLLLPGLLKPGGGVTALELYEETKKRRNAVLVGSKVGKTPSPAAAVISNVLDSIGKEQH